MESLSLCLSTPSPLIKSQRITPKTAQNSIKLPISLSSSSHGNQISNLVHSLNSRTPLKPHISLPILMGFLCSSPLPSIASEIADPSAEASDKINLEAILLSIDDFFNKNPFFVAGCTFIWLIVIPLVEEYVKKYKYTSAIIAFRKLRDDPSVQLVDIRDEKSLNYLGSSDLRILNKDVAQVSYSEADEDGFVKKVLEKFGDPTNTTVCILDNFDGNSMKAAELLFKNGYKEAYAIKGGLRGPKGWQEIQEELLPPSVHVYSKKAKKTRKMDGVANQPDADQVQTVASDN